MLVKLFFVGTVLAATLAPAFAVAQSSAPSSAPAMSEEPAMTVLAKSLLAQAQSGRLDRSLFNAEMNDVLTDANVANVAHQLGALGTPASIALTKHEVADGVSRYQYTIAWPGISMYERFAFDRAGKIAGLAFTPVVESVSTTEDPAMTALATSLLAQAQSGNIERDRLTGEMNAALTPALVASAANYLKPLGRAESYKLLKHEKIGDFAAYRYLVTFATTTIEEQFSLDATGKIAGLFFKPAI